MGEDAYVPKPQLQALQFLEMTITSITEERGQMHMISRLHALMGTFIQLHADTTTRCGRSKGGRFAPRAPGIPAGHPVDAGARDRGCPRHSARNRTDAAAAVASAAAATARM